MKCPYCKGEGGESWVPFNSPFPSEWEDCWHCRGVGKVSLIFWLEALWWEHVPVRFIEWWDTDKRQDRRYRRSLEKGKVA